MGFIDAFVYAHHQHRRCIENPGNFGDCLKGRIRFMTAVTPAYAHAYEATCLTRHMPAVPHKIFRLPKPKARYPHLPNARSTTRVKEVMISRDGPFIQTGVRASRMVKHWLGGVSLQDLTMEELISCLVLSSPPRLILPSQVPELTPATPLK